MDSLQTCSYSQVKYRLVIPSQRTGQDPPLSAQQASHRRCRLLLCHLLFLSHTLPPSLTMDLLMAIIKLSPWPPLPDPPVNPARRPPIMAPMFLPETCANWTRALFQIPAQCPSIVTK